MADQAPSPRKRSLLSRLMHQPRFHRHHHHQKKTEKKKEDLLRSDTPRIFTKRETIALTTTAAPVAIEEKPVERKGLPSLRRRSVEPVLPREEVPDEKWDFKAKEAPKRFAKSVFAGHTYQAQLRIGKLKVKVLEAANLPGVLFTAIGEATSSPYVVMTLEGRAWRSETMKRTLNPKFHSKEVEFHVNRYDAVLSVQIYDEGHDHDDRLGHVEIPVRRLAGHGKIRRYFLLKSHFFADDLFGSSQSSNVRNAAVELELEYDASPFGEAATMIWLDGPKPKKPTEPFDVNCFYKHAMEFKDEVTPYLDFATKAEHVLKWTDPTESFIYFITALLLATRWDLVPSILHFYIISVLLRNYFAMQRTEQLRERSKEIFITIDTDKSKSISRSELGDATRMLIKAANASSKKGKKNKTEQPTETDLDTLFSRFAKGKKELSLDDFTDLVEDCPQIVGAYNAMQKCFQEHSEHDLDTVLDDDNDTESRTSTSSAMTSFSSDGSDNAESSDYASSSTARVVAAPTATTTTTTTPPPSGTGTKTRKTKRSTGGVKSALVKNVMNRVGRRLSFLAYASQKFGTTANDIRLVRRIFQWDPKVVSLSKAAIAGNFVLAWLHRFFPTLYFVLLVCGAFFYYSEKRRALERLVTVGPKALKRYSDLKNRKNLDKDILIDDGRPPSAAEVKAKGGDVRSKALQTVIRSIFNRLDRDDDGTVSIEETVDFVMAAIPRATPSIRSKCMDGKPDIAEVEAHAKDIIDEFDEDGDGKLNFDEVFAFITNAGCAKLLLQDELRRQLMTTGVACLKLPSNASDGPSPHHYPHPWNHDDNKNGPLHLEGRGHSPHVVFGSHQSRITLAGDGQLAYANRYGHAVLLHTIVSVEAHPSRPHIVHIIHKDPPRYHPKTLILSMAEILRNPLVETLQYELLGRPGTGIEGVPHPVPPDPPVLVVEPPPSSSHQKEKSSSVPTPTPKKVKQPPAPKMSPEQMAAMFSG